MRQFLEASRSPAAGSEAWSQLGRRRSMPLKKRWIIGRSRSRSRALHGMRSRLTRYDIEMGLTDENPVAVSHPGRNRPRRQAIMAAMSLPSWQAYRYGQPHHSWMKRWTRKHCRMLLPTVCILMLLCYVLNTGECPPPGLAAGHGAEPAPPPTSPPLPARLHPLPSPCHHPLPPSNPPHWPLFSLSPFITLVPTWLPSESPSVPDFPSPNTDLPDLPPV